MTSTSCEQPAQSVWGRSRRDALVAGVLIGATVVVLGWGSGYGRLLVHEASIAAAPAPGTMPGNGGTGSSVPATGMTGTGLRAEPVAAGDSSASRVVGPAESGGQSAGVGSVSCPSLPSAVLDPFIAHVQRGHLSESPAQQLADLLNTNQYVQTHTVLVEHMTDPLWLLIPAVTEGAHAFVTHVQRGHLGESPSQQVADILDPDQYVHTHTVLVEDMSGPALAVVTGSC